jgi:putative transposase
MELYHVLNRGVDKRKIFLNDRDYFRFVHNLFEFNNQNPATANNYYFSQSSDIGCPKIGKRLLNRKPRKLLVNIHAFCLMPNHYHLLLSSKIEDGIPKFMKKINMGYAKYFNEKNKRVGALFQGKYKSIHVSNDSHFLYIPYYIHLNPLDLIFPEWRTGGVKNTKKAIDYLKQYRWSSYLDYLGIKNFPSLTHRDFLQGSFGDKNKYKKSLIEMIKSNETEELGEASLE